MPPPPLRPTTLALLLAPLSACAAPTEEPPALPATSDPAMYAAEVDAWHARRLASLRRDTGWLTLVGLHPLQEGTHSLGSDPTSDVVLDPAAPSHLGILHLDGEGPWFSAADGVEVRPFADGPQEPIRETAMATDAAGPATVLACDRILFHVIERGGDLYLRVRDRESPRLRAFGGIPRYPADASWRVEGRLEPDGSGGFDEPDVLGNLVRVPSPGVVAFERDGRTHRLRPSLADDGRLFFVFADATSGAETYPAGRFLYADAPDAEGRVVLDFNRSYTPPCAFTPFATCPLPAEGNVLDVPVRAGERFLAHP